MFSKYEQPEGKLDFRGRGLRDLCCSNVTLPKKTRCSGNCRKFTSVKFDRILIGHLFGNESNRVWKVHFSF